MKTYEELLKEALEQVPNSYDKRVGSIMYNAIAPSIYEIWNLYCDDEILLNETFADTASREYLIRRCKERYIEPYPASKAIYKGEFNIPIPNDTIFIADEGLRFQSGDLIEEIENMYYYPLISVEAGSNANGLEIGSDIIPETSIPGLSTPKITGMISAGTDEEETEHLRSRYYESLQYEPFAGNKKAYRDTTNAMDGVLATKVECGYHREGDLEYNVLLTVAGANYEPVPQERCQAIEDAYCPGSSSDGIGIAPLLHKVHVVSCSPVTINVKFRFVAKDGMDMKFDDLIKSADYIFKQYIKKVNADWEYEDNLIIRRNVLIAQLYEGLQNLVKDIVDIRINDSPNNVELQKNQVAVAGTIAEMTGDDL